MLEIEKLGLVEMDSQETVLVDGGRFSITGGGLFKNFSLAYLASQIIDNWDDIKSGLREGYAAGNR